MIGRISQMACAVHRSGTMDNIETVLERIRLKSLDAPKRGHFNVKNNVAF